MGKFITLREEFESETGAHTFADQQYIEWLESIVNQQRKVKNCSIQNVSGSALEVAKQISQVSQTQMALNDQLKILRVAANKLGLYDAADFIRLD